MPWEATAAAPFQVSCPSDLHVLQVHPCAVQPLSSCSCYTSPTVWPHSSNPISKMEKLRPTKETQVINSSLMPFRGQGAPCPPILLPAYPKALRSNCSLWSTWGTPAIYMLPTTV